MNTFCCQGFQNLISNAGKRGLAAIVVRRPLARLDFLLQGRGVAYEDEASLGPNHPLPVRLTISANLGLQYCPFCGYRLQKLIEKSPEPFEALAKEHQKLRAEGLPSG